MREIKFRAWDGKEMHLPEQSDPSDFFIEPEGRLCHIREVGVEGHISIFPRKGWKLMQFTGLKDKNGKEIYEGDIVSYGRRMYEVMINFNGYYLQRYKLWNGKFVPSFQYALSLITKPNKDRFGGEVDNAEVIGNIYENAELLKQ